MNLSYKCFVELYSNMLLLLFKIPKEQSTLFRVNFKIVMVDTKSTLGENNRKM